LTEDSTENSLCHIGDRAFARFLKLEIFVDFMPVTIGDYAFCYTPNLKEFPYYYPKWLSSLGKSAFRMSNFEDIIDLSAVEASGV
jgi:hypothetical protein